MKYKLIYLMHLSFELYNETYLFIFFWLISLSNEEFSLSFVGHDDRTSHSSDRSKFISTKPRVSFKKQHYKQDRNKKKYFAVTNDTDEPMFLNSHNTRHINQRGRGKSFGRGRNSPLPQSTSNRDNRSSYRANDSSWYKVIVSI